MNSCKYSTVIVSKETKKGFVIGIKIECQAANCFRKSKLVNSESFFTSEFLKLRNVYLWNSFKVSRFKNCTVLQFSSNYLDSDWAGKFIHFVIQFQHEPDGVTRCTTVVNISYNIYFLDQSNSTLWLKHLGSAKLFNFFRYQW